MKNLFLALVFLTQGVLAQAIEGELELAGFILGQYRKSVHSELGPPFESRITEDGWIYEFHAIKPDTSVYALFKYPSWDTTRIYSIQLNGDYFDEMKPFRGLKLGVSKDRVHAVFGKASRSEIIEDPPMIIEYYDHHNYSFDIDKDRNTLYGIQIYGRILEQKVRTPAATLRPFQNAVLLKNTDSLLATVSPDIYLYKNGKVISYCGGARGEFQNHSSEMVRLLIGESESVYYALHGEKSEPVMEQRPYNKANDIATVFKFPSSKVLNEIVLIPHAGRWKVYEVKFR